jgi:hypothetical protein
MIRGQPVRVAAQSSAPPPGGALSIFVDLTERGRDAFTAVGGTESQK